MVLSLQIWPFVQDFSAQLYVSFIQYLTYLLVQAEEDGSDEYGNYEKASLNTTKQIISDLENIDMVIHIGDLSYANGYLSQWDQFTAQIEPIASTVPYMIGRSVQSIFFPENFHEIAHEVMTGSI